MLRNVVLSFFDFIFRLFIFYLFSTHVQLLYLASIYDAYYNYMVLIISVTDRGHVCWNSI